MAKLATVSEESKEGPQSVDKKSFLEQKLSKASSQIDTAADGIIGIIAPPGHGKTVLAATFSEMCPDLPVEGADPSNPTILEDAAWILADDKGCASLPPMGVWPLIVEEVWQRPERLGDYNALLQNAIANIAEGVRAGVTKYVVVDTISSIDAALGEYLEDKYAHVDRKMDMWVELSAYHSRFMTSIRRLGIPMIVLFHAKYQVEWISKDTPLAEKKKIKEQAKVKKLPGQYDIDLQMTGKSRGYYQGQCSYVFPLIKESINAVPKIVTDDSANTVVKNRARGLAPREPANLRALWNKIRGVRA